MKNICERKMCSGEREWKPGKYDCRTGLRGDAARTEAYCGLNRPNREIYAYPEWSEIPSGIWIGIGFSAILAMFVQWGTTGAALMIAYLTPTKGLGCRSGGYLLYGSTATVSWLLLAMSSLFSHSTMLRYQREQQKQPIVDPHSARENDTTSHVNGIPLIHLVTPVSRSSSPKSLRSTSASIWYRVPVRGLAAVTRYLGKTLAIANALFVVAISLFEFTGGFDNCWCKSDVIGLGNSGWVALFKTAHDLEQVASVQWGMGVVFSVLVCVISFGVFWGGL